MASAATETANFTSMTEYERQRLENVKRNQAMIAALGIQNAATELQRTTPKKQETRGYKRKYEKRPTREESIVTRKLRSSRVSWAAGEQAEAPAPAVKAPHPVKQEKASALKEPVFLDDVYVQGDTSTRLLHCLRSLEDNIPLSNLYKQRSRLPLICSNFTLKKDDIARVVPEGIIIVAFLPVVDRLVLLAGDKGGHLGFWDVGCNDDSPGAGVHIFEPHAAPISGIATVPFSPTKIFTSSYDGTIRLLDTDRSMFDVLHCTEDDSIVTAISSVPNNAQCIWAGEGNGALQMVDIREKTPTTRFDQLHERRISTIDFNSQSTWLMLTSSTDTSVCVWDVRHMRHASASILKIEHKRAVNSAYFSPSGNSFATFSYDNTIAVVRGPYQQPNGTAQRPVYIDHPKWNNRWISPFRAIWGWDDENVYVGSMKRSIDVVSTSAQRTILGLSSPFMTSIPCRLAAHPLRHGILAGGSAGGQVFMWSQCDQ